MGELRVGASNRFKSSVQGFVNDIAAKHNVHAMQANHNEGQNIHAYCPNILQLNTEDVDYDETSRPTSMDRTPKIH